MHEAGPPPELALAAYALALRVTGDEDCAIASIKAAAPGAAHEPPQGFLNAVRREARDRRMHVPDPETAPRPPELAHISLADWAVLERVAYRGMTVTEAADAGGIDRGDAIRRLSLGLAAQRDLLRERESRRDTEAVRGEVLRPDFTVGGLDNPARDRQAQPAAAGGIGV
jgi:hypothetical protein